jgi:predicted Zn finger-like uncharacterized protein
MNVSCPKCETEFRVDPAKVPVRGVRARCSTCSAVFFVGRPAEAEPVAAPLPPTATVSSPPASSAPVSAVPPSRPSYSAPPPVPHQPAGPGPARPPVAPPAGAGMRPAQPSPAAAPASAPPPPAMGSRAPGYAPSPIPAANVAGFPPASPAGSRPASPPPAAAPTPAPAPPRRPVNPFLATDPSTKARRLARALISDLVVYHPGKRADGLRDGTLKLLFEEEIRKCWEEYSEQVGMEMATSTPYFTEALNEILADGQPVFT